MKIWDASFPLISLKGEGTRKFLQGQISSEILSLKEQEIIRTCWLSPLGKIRALFELRIINDGAEILIISGNVKEVFYGLDSVIFPVDNVSINLAGKIRRVQMMSYSESWRKSSFRWVFHQNKELKYFGNYEIATKSELDKWSIQQGIISDFSLLNLETNPFELGLSDLLNLNKGCFLGQEIIAKLNRIGHVKHELRAFISLSDQMKAGDTLISLNDTDELKNQTAGFISYSFKTAEKQTIGFAFIKRKYLLERELINKSSMIPLEINKPIGFVPI